MEKKKHLTKLIGLRLYPEEIKQLKQMAKELKLTQARTVGIMLQMSKALDENKELESVTRALLKRAIKP